jgi:hypothetical protein
MRSHLLRLRLEMVTAMAKVIQLCLPEKFRKTKLKMDSPRPAREDHSVPRTNKKSA